MAKVKGKRGFRFIKELGGAIRRETVNRTAGYSWGVSWITAAAAAATPTTSAGQP